MTAPTLIAYIETANYQQNFGSKTTPSSLTWQTGDVIVVMGVMEDVQAGVSIGTPTATGLTFAAIGSPSAVTSSCWMGRWQATAGSSGSSAITATQTGSINWGLGVWQYRGSSGVGATPAISEAINTKVQSLIRTGSNSAVICAFADWGAGSTTATYTPGSATQEGSSDGAGATYSVLMANWGDQGAPGTLSYGITAGLSTNAITLGLVEVTGTGGSPAPTVGLMPERWWPGPNGPWGADNFVPDISPYGYTVAATTQVSSDLDLQWAVSQQVTSDLDARWRVANAVTSDADLRWRVANVVTSDADLRWRVYNALTSDVDLRWRTAQQVTSDLDARWRASQQAISNLDLRWRTAQLVNSDLDLRWAVRSVVTSDLDARWRVSQQVSSDADLRWRVAVRVTSDADLRWRVANLVSSDLDARWAVRSIVTSDLDARWRVAAQVFNGLDVQWRVANLASSDLDARWRVFAAITADLDLRWRTRQNVSADLDARWVVNSTLISITSDLDLRWRTRQFVSSDVDLRWRTLEVVSNGLDVQWRVRGIVASDADLRWRVLGVVQGTLDLRWAVYVGVSADLGVLWRVRELVSSDLDVRWVAIAADLPTTPLPADVVAILDGTRVLANVSGERRADVGGTIIVAYLSDYSRKAEL